VQFIGCGAFPVAFYPGTIGERKQREESAPRTANIHYAPVRFMDIEKSAGCFLENPSRSACAMYFSAAAEMNAFFRRTQKQLNGLAIHSRRFYIFKCNCCQEINCLCRPFICLRRTDGTQWVETSVALLARL
jgi:hypothetical protein